MTTQSTPISSKPLVSSATLQKARESETYYEQLYLRTILNNPWIPNTSKPPTLKQLRFLLNEDREILFGGAAGGGKSEALLMAAAMYLEDGAYNALLLRRTFRDLALPGALMDRSMDWWKNTVAHWNDQQKRWTFPSGATVSFGYMDSEADRHRYQGSELQFVGYDELTQFSKTMYTYLFSRLRSVKNKPFSGPLRMRSASNPGGFGHEWVKERFFVETNDGRHFIPATVYDNPHLNIAEYVEQLQELDPITRAQLLEGNWDARDDGNMFRAEWFRIVSAVPGYARRCRYWDLAATEDNAKLAKKGRKNDPDWTAGARVARDPRGHYYLEDIRTVRASPQGVEQLVRQTALLDGTGIPILIEQEPGASGKSLVDYYRREVLPEFIVIPIRPTGSKLNRADLLSTHAEVGNVSICTREPWVERGVNGFLDEAVGFPFGPHDDQIDAVSGAFAYLAQRRPVSFAVGGDRPVLQMYEVR